MKSLRTLGFFIQFIMQRLAYAVFVVAALFLLGATIMAALGQWAWLSLQVGYQGQAVENAGMYAQIGLTFLAIALCFFLPSNRRIMQLENSHRNFSIGMEDVAHAYGVVHAADRQQVFKVSSEFDSVRERLMYMRDHPDLSTLEPSLLEVSAQMSHLSTELAQVYSDDKIARARSFLEQRQEEVSLFNTRLEQAKAISEEMKQWLHEVELEENVCVAQLERLRNELHEIMPELGTQAILTQSTEDFMAEGYFEPLPDLEDMDPMSDDSVIEMPPKAAE